LPIYTSFLEIVKYQYFSPFPTDADGLFIMIRMDQHGYLTYNTIERLVKYARKVTK